MPKKATATKSEIQPNAPAKFDLNQSLIAAVNREGYYGRTELVNGFIAEGVVNSIEGGTRGRGTCPYAKLSNGRSLWLTRELRRPLAGQVGTYAELIGKNLRIEVKNDRVALTVSEVKN